MASTVASNPMSATGMPATVTGSCAARRLAGMARSLRVLHVSKRFWPEVGGVERYVLDLARAQVEGGHEARVLTINRDPLLGGTARFPRVERHEGIDIVRVRAVGGQR